MSEASNDMMTSSGAVRSPDTDPRIDRRLRAALTGIGLGELAAASTVSRHDSPETVEAAVAGSHAAFGGLYEILSYARPGDVTVPFSTAEVPQRGRSPIPLRVYRPADSDGPLPAVIYLHGGGMTIIDTNAPAHHRWCQDLAATGLVVVSVDFRNAWTAEGRNPFPAGLDDCTAAVTWVDEHRTELGITVIVVQGESGGANLTLATSLKLKQQGQIGRIDGVYASVPFISGGYGWPAERKRTELPSLLDNDGYFMEGVGMDLLVAVYDPDGHDAENPLCWPHFASVEDLRGMPPHVVTVNELDPLHDEGISYYRRLCAAGVDTIGRTNLGLTHAAEMIFRHDLPDVNRAAAAAIRDFAHSL